MKPRIQQHEQLGLSAGDRWRLGPVAHVRSNEDPFAVALRAGVGAVVLCGHDQWDFNAVKTVTQEATVRGGGRSTLWNFRYASTGATPAITVSGDDVTIENVRLVYQGTRGDGAVGIYAAGVNRLRLRNVILDGFDVGIILSDVVDFEILGCDVRNRDGYGIAIGSTGGADVPDVGALTGHFVGNCRIGRVHGNHVEVRTVAATGAKEAYPTVDAIFSEEDVSQVSFADNNLEWGSATYYNTTSGAKDADNAWDDSNVLVTGGLTVL